MTLLGCAAIKPIPLATKSKGMSVLVLDHLGISKVHMKGVAKPSLKKSSIGGKKYLDYL